MATATDQRGLEGLVGLRLLGVRGVAGRMLEKCEKTAVGQLGSWFGGREGKGNEGWGLRLGAKRPLSDP